MKRFAHIIATIMPVLGLVGAQTGCAPMGAHLRNGATPKCTCDAGGKITCQSFQVCGVGNTRGNVALTGTYTATVECTNNGGNTVDVQSDSVEAMTDATDIAPKHGCLTVPKVEIAPPDDPEFLDAADCPNPNWTKTVGTISLTDFTYTLTFEGFEGCGAYITIDTCT